MDKESHRLTNPERSTIVSSQCALLQDELFLLHEHRSMQYKYIREKYVIVNGSDSGYVPVYTYRTELCAYHISSFRPLDLKFREILMIPSQKCSITTYNSQLVVVGGMNKETEKALDKIWTSDSGHDEWKQTLPPLPKPRCQPLVLNISGSPS